MAGFESERQRGLGLSTRGGGGTVANANVLREQFPTLEASDFFRDPIDVGFVDDILSGSMETTLANIDRSAELAVSTAENLGAANVGNFQSALASIAPDAVGLQTSRDAAIMSLLAGEVPAQVAQSTARQRAEVSALTGVGATSGFATQRLFRDFGINAIDAIQSGIGFATQALGQEQGLALNLTPRAEGIFGAQLGELQRATVPTAGEVFRLSAEAERSNQLAEMEIAAQNLALDLNAFELAFGADAARDLRRAGTTNALIGAGGTILGSLLRFGSGSGGRSGSGSGAEAPSLSLGGEFSDPTGLTFNEQGFVTNAELTLSGQPRTPGGEPINTSNISNPVYNQQGQLAYYTDPSGVERFTSASQEGAFFAPSLTLQDNSLGYYGTSSLGEQAYYDEFFRWEEGEAP